MLAERAFIADQARATRVGRDAGAPVLGDLVTDRLAQRGVDLDTLAWDAHREPAGPWIVVARFRVGDDEREARWTFDLAKRGVQADEDEARWLSETELADEPIPRRHLAAVRDVVFDVEADGSLRPVLETVDPGAPDPEPRDRTAALLDDLTPRRGVRQKLDLDDDDEEFEGFGPQHAFDLSSFEQQPPGAHPVDVDPSAEAEVFRTPSWLDHATSGDQRPTPVAPTAPVLPAAVSGDVPDDDPTTVEGPVAAERPRARKGRAKVPSWDEIVFGAKPE